LRETLYRSTHAKGVCNVEEVLSELRGQKSKISPRWSLSLLLADR
jgi:hypothetical protein